MEIWDLYNGERQPLNKTHVRGQSLSPGEYHVIVEIWTVNSEGRLLLTLRHPDKDIFPGFWENTGGSILAGETSRQGAVRELFEETGIAVEESELHYLGTRREESAHADTYIVKKDAAIEILLCRKAKRSPPNG